MVYALIIRMGLGLFLGILLAYIFGLEGVTKNVVILATATPVGYNTLTFSSVEIPKDHKNHIIISIIRIRSKAVMPAKAGIQYFSKKTLRYYWL